MKILVTGSSGLIGSALVGRLVSAGHDVARLVRRNAGLSPAEIPWDPAAATLDAARLEGFEAVVHLAGENLAEGRWTAAKKQRIVASRVESTRRLAAALAKLTRPPSVLLSASAVGWYGNRGDEELDESSLPGDGFLADVCRQWEAAAQPAVGAGLRVVCLRTGVVLDRGGGALARLLPLFRLGLGGRLGSGRQSMSWISLDDAVGAIVHLLARPSLAGAVNLTAPQPLSNAEFTRTLARVLRRPALLSVPAFALRLMLGEMADAMLLAGAKVLPRRLLASGYEFHDPVLEPALQRILGR